MTNSGVYKIWFTGSNNYYIGSSITLSKRKKSHLSCLQRKSHNNIALQNAYNKYGKDNFNFEVLINTSKEATREVEQWYLDYHKPSYNIKKIAKGGTEKQLTPACVLAIFEKSFHTSAYKIGQEFGCSKTLIQAILYRNAYPDVKIPRELIEKILSTKKTVKSTRSIKAGVDDTVAGEIKYILSKGAIGTNIAKHYNISYEIVKSIKHGNNYRNIYPVVTYPISECLFKTETKGNGRSVVMSDALENIIFYKNIKNCAASNDLSYKTLRRIIKSNVTYNGFTFKYA